MINLLRITYHSCFSDINKLELNYKFKNVSFLIQNLKLKYNSNLLKMSLTILIRFTVIYFILNNLKLYLSKN